MILGSSLAILVPPFFMRVKALQWKKTLIKLLALQTGLLLGMPLSHIKVVIC